MKKKYRVTLPISVVDEAKKETTYMPGEFAELDAETATRYAHALIEAREKKEE